MKGIGLRMIKTAIAVFICLMIYILLKLIERLPMVNDDFAYSWYNPFFAGLATAYSLHSSKRESLAQAKNRCVASLIGGIIGILLISAYEAFGGIWPTSNTISLDTFNFIIPYVLIGVFTILVIWVGISLNQRAAVFVSILTFLSVTVNPNPGIPNWQWQFGLNRILSTVIGVGIALMVNLFRLPHRIKNKNLLFCMEIDGIFLKDTDEIKGYIQYKMNHFNDIGINLTLFTTRTPATFMPLIKDLQIEHPIVCLSGAALYDIKNKKYIGVKNIDQQTSDKIIELLVKHNISPFINFIDEDVLFIYNECLDNEGERVYAESKKNAPYCCFIHGKAPKREVTHFIVIEKKESAHNIIRLLKESDIADKISILVYDVFELQQDPELCYVKIYSSEIDCLDNLKEYANENSMKLVGLTASNHAPHLMKNSDISISLESVNDQIKELCDEVIPSSSPNDLFNRVNKIYYKNVTKYSKK